MDSKKFINELSKSPNYKVIYDIIKKPVEMGGFDIENANVIETLFNKNKEHFQGKIRIRKKDFSFDLILNKVESINIFSYEKLNDVTISIENGENDLVFLIKNGDEIVINVEFDDGEFNFDYTKIKF